jgi:hypothetical protein
MSQKVSKELAKELAETGMKAKAYARSPVAGAGFIINQSNNQIRTWAIEGSEIEVAGKSKRHRQAALTVVEGPRKLEANRWHSLLLDKTRIFQATKDNDLMELVQKEAKTLNPLQIPNGRRKTTIQTDLKNIQAQLKASLEHTTGTQIRIDVKAHHEAESKVGQTFNLGAQRHTAAG